MTLRKERTEVQGRTVSYNPQVFAKFAGCHGAFAAYRNSVKSLTKFRVS